LNLLENKADLIKVGIAAAIIIFAVVYFFHGNHSNQIVVMTSSHNVGQDPNSAISSNNPLDPKSPQDTVIYSFADNAGDDVLITEYPNDPNRQPLVSFTPSRQSLGNKPYQTWFILSLNDPAKEALLRAYLGGVQTGGPENGVRRVTTMVRRTGATRDQQQKIATLNQQVIANISGLVIRWQKGNVEPDELAQLKQALVVYNMAPGDPMTNSSKADLARKVLALGTTYASEDTEQQNTAVTDYINSVDELLTSAQRQQLQQSIQPWLDRNK
jgi:hypothetical protein